MRKFILLLIVNSFICTLHAQMPDLSNCRDAKAKLVLISKYVQSCGSHEKYQEAIDAMKIGIKIAKEARIDSTLVQYYYFTGVSYAVSNVDSALIYLREAEKLACKIHNTKYLVRSEFELLNIYHQQSKTDSIAPLMQSLKNESTKLDSLSWEKATLLNNLGYAYYRQLKYNESLGYFFKALHIYEHLKDTSDIAVLWHILGNAYQKLNLYDQSISYYLKARALYLQKGTELRASECSDDLGLSYAQIGKLDSAVICHRHALKIAEKYHAYESSAYASLHLGEVYIKLKQFPLAEPYLTKALNIGQKNNFTPIIIDAFMDLGNINFEQQKFDKAAYFYKKAYELALTNERKTLLVEACRNLAKTEAALGNFSKAYQYQAIYITYKDSITTETSNKNIAEMEAKYQNEQKQHEILLLNEKNKTQSLLLKSKQLSQNLLFAGLFLIIIIAGLLWRSYAIKQKANIALGQKNNEISEAYQQISEVNEKLNEANQSKSKLFSIISHDLRGPVNSLFQFLSLQKNNPDRLNAEEKTKHNDRIIQSAENLSEVMEDLLIWSKSQMESFELSLEKISVKELLDEVSLIYDIHLKGKNLLLNINCPSDLLFSTDVNFLKIIIRNLLNNAIKFSPENDKISISVSESLNGIRLSFKNNGIGLNKEQIAGMDNWQSIKSSSSGLGLKLTREFVEKLNGTLDIISEAGKGTDFIVNLNTLP